MSKDESRPKDDQPTVPGNPYTGTGSLDFTDRSPAPSPVDDVKTVVRRRTTAVSSDRKKAGSSRRVAVAFLIVVAIALVIAFVLSERPSKEPVTPSPSATPTAPAGQSPPTREPPRTSTPPPPASTAQSMPAPAVPAEILKAFQEYAAKPSGKAIALALDNDGRSAHVSVFGHATQVEANEAALSECARYKVQLGVQENCRLYAEGDKVIW